MSTHCVEHTQDGFNKHTNIPCPTLARFDVRAVINTFSEMGVGENNHSSFVLLDKRILKNRIGRVGCFDVPITDQTEFIENQRKFAANNPTVIRSAFAPDLFR